jgi:hypothetical protein
MFKTLMKDKQTLHIVGEIVIICGIVYYFNQKNKNMMVYIQNLTQRIEEQEDIIQKHEQVIKNLSEGVYNLSNELRNVSSFISSQLPKSNNIPPTKKSQIQPVHNKPPLKIKKEIPPKSQKQVSFQENLEDQEISNSISQLSVISESDSDSDNSLLEDLDNEISEELQELEEITEPDLKKQ